MPVISGVYIRSKKVGGGGENTVIRKIIAPILKRAGTYTLRYNYYIETGCYW